MKLSDAIRHGAAQTAPLTGSFADIHPDTGLSTCAIGAAVVGRYGLGYPESIGLAVVEELYETYTELDTLDAQCPRCSYRRDLFGVITHLNDREGMSREAIADWLDSISVDLTVPVETAVPA